MRCARCIKCGHKGATLGFDCGTTGKFRPVVLWGGRQRPKGGEGRVEQHLDRFFGVYLEGFLDAVVEDFATP